jgi:hypothetical protein
VPQKGYWLQEGLVYCARHYGRVTLQDIAESDRTTRELLDQATQPVMLVVDASKIESFPIDLSRLNQTITFMHHPQLGPCVLIATNPLVNILGEMITRVIGSRFYVVRSPQDALRKLQALDQRVQIEPKLFQIA